MLLHEERGFTISGRVDSAELLVQSVLNVVLPDDDCGEEHPWPWLVELARARGLDVTEDELRGLGYDVILGDQVSEWLSRGRITG